MKQLTDLKQGDIIYDVRFSEIIKYKYLCVHPTGQGHYHILINSYEEPIRIYDMRLQGILNKDLKTYEEAKLKLADLLEERAKRLRIEKY
jgi:hypothetical protein